METERVMQWVEIKKSLPENEVLAANFEKGTYGVYEKLIGYLSVANGIVVCESDNEILENCTHYIDIDNFDII